MSFVDKRGGACKTVKSSTTRAVLFGFYSLYGGSVE